MKYLRHTYLSVSLIVCILFVGAAFAVQSPAHAFHHSHHQASTHASLLCSWMCAAGQVDQTADPVINTPGYETGGLTVLTHEVSFRILIRSIFPRGPPVR